MTNDLQSFTGKTITKIEGMEKGSDVVRIFFQKGGVLKFYHEQDCCEEVEINDVCGDVEDLIGVPLLLIEESQGEIENTEEKWWYSGTWTFYKFSTIKGSVTVRWVGESNGYYSEEVDWSFENDK